MKTRAEKLQELIANGGPHVQREPWKPEVTEEPLPEWALTFAKDYETQFAALPTRDGRVTGNGVVVDFIQRIYFYGTTYQSQEMLTKVVTDAGNIIFCTGKELRELFHPPKWVMRNLLPAHVQALSDELHYGQL